MNCPQCSSYVVDSAAVCDKCGALMPVSDSAATLETTDSYHLEPGADLGARYRIESLIGQGGMGRVYKAYDRELERTVALKVVRADLIAKTDTQQRFKQELLLASRISHRNILRIHDLGEANGLKFITMAYVEGSDLDRLLRESPQLPFQRIRQIAIQLCEALQAAHAEGVIHRDLKPQNILIGLDDHVFVSDFGLAKSLQDNISGLTRTGVLIGTPRYMSPEQVQGKPLDQRVDIYSLGLILYEMATGDLPFKAQSAVQLMDQRVKNRPENPKKINPELPDYFARAILRCLEPDPRKRYQTAVEILSDLQDAGRSSSGARTVQISLPQGGRKWVGIAAISCIAVAVAVFSVPASRRAILGFWGSKITRASSIPSLENGKFVAVLPFRILGDQQQLGYVADGLQDALSAKLFQVRNVHVASETGIAKLNGSESLEQAAGELGVNLIVRGTVQGSSDSIRVIVNLENVADQKRIWSEEFSGTSADLLKIEDQIYAHLVNVLDVQPGTEELARAAVHPTDNIEAYDLYLKGRNSMRGQQDVKNVQTALDYYQNALKKDPSFALAYAGLADASLVMYRETKDSFWSQKALTAAKESDRLNDKLPEVHFALGNVYSHTGNNSEAISELQKALDLAPNSDDGYRDLGEAYVALGKKEEAIQAFQKAIQINPYYWYDYNGLGVAYSQFGEYDKALDAFHHVIELEPENSFGYLNTGAIYFQEGKYDECIPYYRKALQIQPYYLTYSNLGTAYFFLKRYSDSVPMFEKAVEMNPTSQLAMGNLADAYRWSGQRDKANATYDKAIALAYKDLAVNPNNADTMSWLAVYYAKKGDPERALDFIRRARSITPSDVNLMYVEAQVYVLAGRPADGLQALRHALQKGYSLEEVKSDPELGPLQGRPEFAQLLKHFEKSN